MNARIKGFTFHRTLDLNVPHDCRVYLIQLMEHGAITADKGFDPVELTDDQSVVLAKDLFLRWDDSTPSRNLQ